MITLERIRVLAGRIFPNAHADLVRLLYAWATLDPGTELSSHLEGTGMDTARMRASLEPLLDLPSPEDREFLAECILKVKEAPVTGMHILRAICLAPRHRISRSLVNGGLDLDKLKARMDEHNEKRKAFLARHGIGSTSGPHPIEAYGRDLTALAKEGAFEDLCDRPGDIERLLDVLLRRQKANVALTGPAGVGKTALVELLARRLAKGSVSDLMAGTRVFELAMGKLVAGTRYRGDFEERMNRMLAALESYQPVILFIDEMHLIWGAGRAEGVITDAANLLKPLLARGRIRVIGSTTIDEYQRYIVRDEALARRFQEIRLGEPDKALSFEIVRTQAEALSLHHGVSIGENTIRKVIELADRHLPNRHQPDKSVDLLDSASVLVVREGRKTVLETDLLQVLARQTGRPVTDLSGEDRSSLGLLTQRLKTRIIGQDQAVDRVSSVLIRRRQDLGDPSRNLGTFLFVGPTGVGKSELARAMAAEFFADEKALLQIDLAEYGLSGTTHKLIGSPPGYIDSEKEGILIGWLHQHGSGVILFDEVEKAHQDVQHLLLGLLESGRISSGRGEVMDARQCVVVLTSNAVTHSGFRRGTIGFGKREREPDPEELLADHFPREFLGRLDGVILFNPLGAGEMRQIMKLRLDEALTRLEKKGIRLVFDEQRLLDHLLSELRNLKSGARGIARLLESRLLQPVSQALLDHEWTAPVRCELNEAFYENAGVTVTGAPSD